MKYTLVIAALMASTSAISLTKDCAPHHEKSLHHIEKAAHAAALKSINKFIDEWESKQDTADAIEETKKAVKEVKKEAEKAEKKKELKSEEEKVVKALEKMEEKNDDAPPVEEKKEEPKAEEAKP